MLLKLEKLDQRVLSRYRFTDSPVVVAKTIFALHYVKQAIFRFIDENIHAIKVTTVNEFNSLVASPLIATVKLVGNYEGNEFSIIVDFGFSLLSVSTNDELTNQLIQSLLTKES